MCNEGCSINIIQMQRGHVGAHLLWLPCCPTPVTTLTSHRGAPDPCLDSTPTSTPASESPRALLSPSCREGHAPSLLRGQEAPDLLPDIRKTPLGSTARQVTASRWATMECTNFPAGREWATGYFSTLRPAWKGAGVSGDTKSPRWTLEGIHLRRADPCPPPAQVSGGWGGWASPVRLSRKRMPLSSWAVMVRGWLG